MNILARGSRNRLIVRAYQEGQSLRQLAACLQISVEGVRRVLVMCGVERRPPHRCHAHPPMTEAQQDTAWQLYNRGHSQKAIAERIGRPVKHIRDFLRSRGAPAFRNDSPGRPWTDAEIDFVLAHRPDQSFGWIAKQLGRSRNSVIGLAYRLRREETERAAREPSMNAVLAG